jgi:hypothetical protein
MFSESNPVAHDFGLIQAPLEKVVAELQNWHRAIGIEYSRTKITSSTSDAFDSLLPLAKNKSRRLFVATRSDWVACFQNGIHGSDPFPAMSHLALRMGVLSMRVCSTPTGALYPATIWEVYAPEFLGGRMPVGYRRSIAAANDGGRWIFEESGERFPFEQVGKYTERRKRDRFTREMLCDYIKEFGIELFADDFLRVDGASPAVRLQQRIVSWRAAVRTLQQVAAGILPRKK